MHTEIATQLGTKATEPTGQTLSILRFAEVTKKTGLSRGAISQRLRNSEFPEPINLGGRAVGFIEHEINAWIAQLIRAIRRESCDAGQQNPPLNTGTPSTGHAAVTPVLGVAAETVHSNSQ